MNVSSVGVRPVWMGKTGRTVGGFDQLRQRNQRVVTHEEHTEMEAQRVADNRAVHMRLALSKKPVHVDVCKLSDKMRMRLAL